MKLHKITNPLKSRTALVWFFSFLFWMAQILQSVLYYPDILERPRKIIMMFITNIEAFLICIFLAYCIKVFSVTRFSMRKLIIMTLLATLMSVLLWYYVERFVFFSVWGSRSIMYTVFYIKEGYLNFFSTLVFRGYLFLAWSGLYLGYLLWEQWNEEKLKVERERSFARQSELEMLRYQLNPHFLFNTLSSLRALVRQKDNETAEEMVTKISEFLKYSLLEGEKNVVPLSREIKIIKHYFDIEKVRFRDELVVEYRIDPKAEECTIPVFLIHPLIENAVKHGRKSSPSPLRITLQADLVGEDLHINIINTGKWIEPAPGSNGEDTSTGLVNTRKRLKLAYPENHTFEIMKEENTVHIKIIITKQGFRESGQNN